MTRQMHCALLSWMHLAISGLSSFYQTELDTISTAILVLAQDMYKSPIIPFHLLMCIATLQKLWGYNLVSYILMVISQRAVCGTEGGEETLDFLA
jgi:hypothetical protein